MPCWSSASITASASSGVTWPSPLTSSGLAGFCQLTTGTGDELEPGVWVAVTTATCGSVPDTTSRAALPWVRFQESDVWVWPAEIVAEASGCMSRL